MSDEISHYAHDHRPPLIQRYELDGARAAASDHDPHARSLLSLVVPFYNEATIVDALSAAVVPVLSSISHVDYEIVCVNDAAEGATVIPFDADLQDSPEVIPQLVARWQEGYDVVLAKSAERCTDT